MPPNRVVTNYAIVVNDKPLFAETGSTVPVLRQSNIYDVKAWSNMSIWRMDGAEVAARNVGYFIASNMYHAETAMCERYGWNHDTVVTLREGLKSGNFFFRYCNSTRTDPEPYTVDLIRTCALLQLELEAGRAKSHVDRIAVFSSRVDEDAYFPPPEIFVSPVGFGVSRDTHRVAVVVIRGRFLKPEARGDGSTRTPFAQPVTDAQMAVRHFVVEAVVSAGSGSADKKYRGSQTIAFNFFAHATKMWNGRELVPLEMDERLTQVLGRDNLTTVQVAYLEAEASSVTDGADLERCFSRVTTGITDVFDGVLFSREGYLSIQAECSVRPRCGTIGEAEQRHYVIASHALVEPSQSRHPGTDGVARLRILEHSDIYDSNPGARPLNVELRGSNAKIFGSPDHVMAPLLSSYIATYYARITRLQRRGHVSGTVDSRVQLGSSFNDRFVEFGNEFNMVNLSTELVAAERYISWLSDLTMKSLASATLERGSRAAYTVPTTADVRDVRMLDARFWLLQQLPRLVSHIQFLLLFTSMMKIHLRVEDDLTKFGSYPYSYTTGMKHTDHSEFDPVTLKLYTSVHDHSSQTILERTKQIAWDLAAQINKMFDTLQDVATEDPPLYDANTNPFLFSHNSLLEDYTDSRVGVNGILFNVVATAVMVHEEVLDGLMIEDVY